VNDHDVVVFDSCTRAITARAIIAEIHKLTPKPVRILINSHWHQDHWSGNNEYAKAFPGLRIIATAETRAFMSRMGAEFFVAETDSFGGTKMREDLARAIETGKLDDGTVLTPELRARREASVARMNEFEAAIRSLPHVLPNLTYSTELTFWSGSREFRLMSMTGDAKGSTVLLLPKERILVTGDVLVSPEDGEGPPPWTTNSAVTSWLDSLRRLEALDAIVIVPGQGPAMHDKSYLRRTIALISAVIDQVHAALAQGTVKLKDVQAAIHVDDLARSFTPGKPLSEDYPLMLQFLVKKALAESLDGADVG
jgi:glyoxylase-like metal-dependent hydrolase (beta-lactamase superfamily II)